MNCTQPKVFNFSKPVYNFVMNKFTKSIEVPCGKCQACKMNSSTEWGDRLSHELPYHEKKCFVTLTYDEKNMPLTINNGKILKTLSIRDIQLWNKKLRQQLGSFKFFIAGEYGPKTKRPHYHGIYFGINVTEMSSTGYALWKKCESRNFVVKEVDETKLRYTAKYLVKENTDWPINYPKQKPFKLCSKGLGKEWALKNKNSIISNGYIIWPNGKKHPIPRYYKKLLGLTARDIRQLTDFNINDYIKKTSIKNSLQREKNLNTRAEITQARRDL